MSVPSEPFAAVYEDQNEDQNRLGVIVARTGRGGFEAFAADDHCLGLFRTPREAPRSPLHARGSPNRSRAFHARSLTCFLTRRLYNAKDVAL
jgi:hypothetical protein